MLDRKTFLFILFSLGVLFLWQYVFVPPASESTSIPDNSIDSPIVGNDLQSPVVIYNSPERESASVENITVETSLVEATFNSDNASLISYVLKQHQIDGQGLDLIFSQANNQGALGLSLGKDGSPLPGPYYLEEIDSHQFSFWQEYQVLQANGSLSAPFKVEKIFTFHDDEYLFGIEVVLENSENAILPLSSNGYAYSINFGPELGPQFEELVSRQVYRRFYTLSGDKRSELKVKNGEPAEEIFSSIKWGGVTGKYFSSVIIPPAKTVFSAWSKEDEIFQHEYKVSRASIKSSIQSDSYYIFLGPRIESAMKIYDDPSQNEFALIDTKLEKMIDNGGWLSWLEVGLKFLLDVFYSWIPNYGVAIIFLTILIKIFLFPFTHKSYESTSRMQKLQPKMKELQDKYKENPQKLNTEMAALYRKYGVNPAGGCLPMLLQLPFFIAIYQMLSKNFDLRGAVFIPGVVTDLSVGDSLYTFTLAGMTVIIRLLPLLYLGSQLLIAKTMPTASAPGVSTKMFTVYMPIIFFFIMYRFPSGLLLYWTLSNLITIVQQKVSNKLNKNKNTDLVPVQRKEGRLERLLKENQKRMNHK